MPWLESGFKLLLENGSSLLLESGLMAVATFSYTISDGTNFDTATITINIDVANASAQDDAASVTAGNSVTVSVLANDSPSGVELDLIVTPPTKGTAEIISGQIKYTANSGTSGTDAVEYQIRNPLNNSTDIGILNITINPGPSGGDTPFDVQAWQNPTITETRFVSQTGSGDGLTWATAWPWATGIAWLEAGRRIILIPGNYGNQTLNLTSSKFNVNNPAVIEAEHHAVTIPATWPQTAQSETYCPTIERAHFTSLTVRGIGLIIRGIHCNTARLGDTTDGVSKWVLWRNCHFDWLGLSETGAPTHLFTIQCNGNGVPRFWGVQECAGMRGGTTGPKTGHPDYWIAIFRTKDVYIDRCVTEGAYNHGISAKEKVSLKVVDTYFRATGNSCAEAGQSMEHTVAATGAFSEFTCDSVEFLRCRFLFGNLETGQGADCLRIKNVVATIIDSCVFVGNFSSAIFVNLFGPVGGEGIDGNFSSHKILNRKSPNPLTVEIKNCSFLNNNDLILNCRGGTNETITVTNCTGTPSRAKYGRFNPMGYDPPISGQAEMHYADFNLNAYPTIVQSGNTFTVTQSTTLIKSG